MESVDVHPTQADIRAVDEQRPLFGKRIEGEDIFVVEADAVDFSA